ncbi:MAG: hypothetical protein Q9225_004997 [Loekoesia sp. 1 TL-2023]
MTRKKKPPPHPKRQEITDSEGWTHIRRSHKKTYLNNSFTSPKTLLPAEIPKGQTLLDLHASHAHYRKQWLSSPYHQTLQTLLQNDLPTSRRFQNTIDRCIVLGLGSLSNGRRSSWWELVFLQTILDFLSLPSSSPIISKNPPPDKQFTIYIQDPVFNDLDSAFLKSLGYTVLSDPEAFDHITQSTFLFAPHLEVDVFVKALGRAKPRLCVGTDIGECLDRYVQLFLFFATLGKI